MGHIISMEKHESTNSFSRKTKTKKTVGKLKGGKLNKDTATHPDKDKSSFIKYRKHQEAFLSPTK